MSMLAGYKTYMMAVALAAYAIGGAVYGAHDWSHAYELLLGSGGLSALRAAIK